MSIALAPVVRVDEKLLAYWIETLGLIGASEGTGVRRPVYSPEWVQATQQYAAWCEESGLKVRQDQVGNVWGRLEGTEGGACIASGSHIDTQLPGGRYDGALGCLAGLLALRCLFEQFGAPKKPLECVAFCEEEGSRFPAANLWGSRAVVGSIDPQEPYALRDYDQVTMADAMLKVGLDPKAVADARRRDIAAFLELHVEQGPILEHAGVPLGIVTGITGLRHYVVEVEGQANHAGAFPMDLRLDPMAGAAEMINAVIGTATAWGRPAVSTVGRVEVFPNYPAIIPQRVRFTIDARHPEPAGLAQLFEAHERSLREIASRRGLKVQWTVTLDKPPAPSNKELVGVLQDAAKSQGIETHEMHSGAGHDSQVMAAIAPMAMVFVQSQAGRSHTPEEYTAVENAALGVQALAAAMYRLAW